MPTKELLSQAICDFPQLEGKSDSYIDAFLSVRLDKKPVCKKGKLCNDVCIPKNAKCRDGDSVKTDITNNKELHSNLARYGFVGGGAAVAAIVAGAGAQVAYDVSKITAIAKPTKEEETVNYDDFKPGDLIRKRTILSGAAVHHYAVYAGKDPKTGEHQIIHTQAPEDKNHQTSSSVIRKTPIHGDSGKSTNNPETASKRYVKVPESEMYQKEGSTRFSRSEILKRANQAINTDYTFQTFSSNCEVFARGVTEGVAYSSQGDAVSPLTRALGDFSSEAVTALTKKQYLSTKTRKTGAEIVAHLNKESKVRKDSQSVQDIGFGYINVLESRPLPPAQNTIDDYCDRVGIKRPEIYSGMVNELTKPLGTLKKATQIKMYSNYAQVFFGTIKSEEILSGTKNDSYLVGFHRIRFDKKPKCGSNTKLCGDRCIKKEWECHEDKLKTNLKSPGAISTGFPIGAAAGIGGAIALGGAATYATIMKHKADYRGNMVSVASRAREASKDVPIPAIPKSQKNISLIVGGFGTEDAYSESLKLEKEVRALGGLKDHYFEPIEYKDYNIAQATSEVNPKVAMNVARQSWELYKNSVIKNKGNPVAERLAAKVYAYSQAYPDKTINLIGHSGGGLTSQETAEITKILGVKTRVTAIGTPNFFGFLKPTEDSVTLYSPNDEIQKASVGAPLNMKRFNNVKHHDIESYFEDNEVKEFMRDRLRTKTKNDSLRLDRDAKCKTGKPCKTKSGRTICIPKDSKCASEKGVQLKESEGEIGKLLTPIAAGAALVGMPTAAYVATVASYQGNIDNSVKEVQQMAAKIEPNELENFNNKEQITFVSPGFGRGMGKVREGLLIERLKGEVGNAVGKKHGLVVHQNEDFNVTKFKGIDESEDFDKNDLKSYFAPAGQEGAYLKHFLKDATKQILNTTLVKKKNPEALKLAAKALAYNQKYPNKPINIVGYSAGGMISGEAEEILSRSGVKNVKVVNFGTPYFGMLKEKPNVISVHSKGDPITKLFPTRKQYAKPIDDVRGHLGYFLHSETPKFLNETFNKGGRRKADSTYYDRSHISRSILWNLIKNNNRIDAIDTSSFNERKLIAQIRALLTRATGNVDAIGNIQSKEPGKITGLFKDGTQVLEFILTNDKLKYKAAIGKRVDSFEFRQDAAKKKSRCQRGIACGSSCIAKNKTCELSTSRLASPNELTRLRQSVMAFNLEQNATQTPTPTPENQPQEDPYKSNTIRELKKIASQKGVVGYSSMTSDQLRSAITLVDKAPPEQQDRIARTLAKDRSSINRAAMAAGLKGKQKRAAADASRTWKNLESLAKFAGSQPVGWGVAATGAFLLGASIRSYERAKGDYRSRLKENAEQAQEKAATLSPARVGQLNNITFIVGSAKVEENKPSGAQNMIDKLKESVKDSDDEGEKWLANKQFFVPFDLKESGAPAKGNLIEDAVSGLKDYMGNFLKKKDQDAVDLAAQLYAYGIQRTPDTRKKRELDKLDRGFNQLNKNKAKLDEQYKDDLENAEYKAKAAAVDAEIKKNRQGYKAANARPDKGDRPLANKGKNINILAHSRGGQTAKTALEYLARMNIPGEPSGKEVLEQVNLVMLGTPHFGFTENVSKRQRTLISAQDPVSKLPVFGEGARQEWVSSVKGHGAEDYIKDPRARESIREAFGYYQDSLLQRKRKQRKNNNDSSDTDRVDSQKGIKCGKGYISVGEKCKSAGAAKEYKRKVFRASLGRGVIAGNFGGIGNDIERAYIKSKRLINQTKAKIQKKELTRKEKVLDEVTYQLKHLGIIAGKGTISKKLRGLDKKLIDLEEGIKEFPESVQNAIKKAVEVVKKKASQLLVGRQEKTDSVDIYWDSFVNTLMAPAVKLATEELAHVRD